MVSRRRLLCAIVLSTTMTAGAGYAGLSPMYVEFPKGPAQWLMTSDEAKAFRAAKTDEEAQRLIDLFWARRDPTPGTPRNEFREEFESRVAIADHDFKFRNKRGSLTDHGRVFIVLGPPKGFSQLAGKLQDTGMINAENAPLANNEQGGKDTWEYTNPASVGLTGPVVFVENTNNHEYFFDTQQGNVTGALSVAVRKAIVSPNLTEVPPWATGPAVAEARRQHSLAVSNVKGAPALPPPPKVTEPPGARALTLTKDVTAIDPRAAKNPLASATSLATFTKQDDLGYALQYCMAVYDPELQPTLKVGVTIDGKSGDETVHMTAPEDDVIPDAIKSLPGCYLVRGSLPLADVGTGAYKLTLALTDPATQQKYNLEQEFKVE
jgi:GWxTD domain-containing protein